MPTDENKEKRPQDLTPEDYLREIASQTAGSLEQTPVFGLNSRAFRNMVKAVKALGEGKGDPQKALEAVEKYLRQNRNPRTEGGKERVNLARQMRSYILGAQSDAPFFRKAFERYKENRIKQQESMEKAVILPPDEEVPEFKQEEPKVLAPKKEEEPKVLVPEEEKKDPAPEKQEEPKVLAPKKEEEPKVLVPEEEKKDPVPEKQEEPKVLAPKKEEDKAEEKEKAEEKVKDKAEDKVQEKEKELEKETDLKIQKAADEAALKASEPKEDEELQLEHSESVKEVLPPHEDVPEANDKELEALLSQAALAMGRDQLEPQVEKNIRDFYHAAQNAGRDLEIKCKDADKKPIYAKEEMTTVVSFRHFQKGLAEGKLNAMDRKLLQGENFLKQKTELSAIALPQAAMGHSAEYFQKNILDKAGLDKVSGEFGKLAEACAKAYVEKQGFGPKQLDEKTVKLEHQLPQIEKAKPVIVPQKKDVPGMSGPALGH